MKFLERLIRELIEAEKLLQSAGLSLRKKRLEFLPFAKN
jgi:hypothetical protein